MMERGKLHITKAFMEVIVISKCNWIMDFGVSMMFGILHMERYTVPYGSKFMDMDSLNV